MRRVEIDRANWARGINQSANYLLGDEKAAGQCCIGIYFSALGVPDEVLLDQGVAEQIIGDSSRTDIDLEEANWLLEDLMGGNNLYALNDAKVVDESKIAAAFALHDVEIIFTGEGHPRK